MNNIAVSESSKIYSCQKCRKIYKSESGLYIHVKMRHQLQYHRSGAYTPLADERDGTTDSTTAVTTVTGAGCAAADVTAAADAYVTEDAAASRRLLWT